MGKDKKSESSVNQQQSVDTSFQNSEFQRNLQQMMQSLQQQQQTQQQQTQQTSGQTTGTSALTGAQQTQQATGVDAASQAFIEQMRQQALGGLGSFGAGSFAPSVQSIQSLTQDLQNPFTQQVIGGVGQQFDQLRDQARMGVQQQATAAGAFGGSRHGVAEAQRLAELDRAQTQQVGNLLSQGFQQAQGMALPLAQQQAMAPVQAELAKQQLLGSALGPTGQVTTGQQTQQQTQQMQQQQMQEALSNLLGLSSLSSLQQGQQSGQTSNVQSGMQNTDALVRGKTTNIEKGNWLNDLMGIGLVAGSFIPGK